MSYRLLSGYYDELVRFDYKGYFNFIKEFLPLGKGLDLACGSGILTAMLSVSNREMTGMDNSAEMLTLAAARAKKERQKILFLSADLNGLEISKKYDFVISSCDGLNYVNSIENLKSLFDKVHNCLNKGGVFIFDISTEKKASDLDGNVFYEDTDDYTLLWTNKKTGNRVDMDVTVFTRQGEKYIRQDETSTQYFYGADTVLDMLAGSGFTVSLYDGETFKKFSGDSNRLLAVAKA